MMNKKLQKTMAVLAMVGFMGTTSLVNISEAAVPPRQEINMQQRNRQPQERPQNNRDNQPRNNRDNQPRQNNRPENRRDNDRNRPAPQRMSAPRRDAGPRYEDREHHSDTGNLVTGLIIGGVLGAIIANNTK